MTTSGWPDWGTVPAWVSAGSFVVAAQVYVRDRVKHRSALAAEVAVGSRSFATIGPREEDNEYYHVARIDNASKFPIHHCLLHGRPKPLKEVLKHPQFAEIYWQRLAAFPDDVLEAGDQKNAVLHYEIRGVDDPKADGKDLSAGEGLDLMLYVPAGGSRVIRLDLGMPTDCYVFYFSFIDYRGRQWQLNLDTMILRPAQKSYLTNLYLDLRKWFGLDGNSLSRQAKIR